MGPLAEAYTLVILLGWVFQTRCPANVSSVGKLTADFIAIINFGSRKLRLQSTQHEPRSHDDAQNKQPTIPRVPRRCITYRLAFIWCTRIDVEHRHKSNSDLFYLFKHVACTGHCQSNGDSMNVMMLTLIPGPQIAAKIGNPAGILCRRIWYSVGKSGVLGIMEYRQGRPLMVHDGFFIV